MSTFHVSWPEDGTPTCLGRITARNANGDATGKAGEGKWLQQGDISSITYNAYDLDGDDPDTPISGYEDVAVTVATAVLDTPVATDEIWTADGKTEDGDTITGYNFVHDLPAAIFAIGGRRYRIEYTINLSGGGVCHGSFVGPARPIKSS